MDVCPNCGAPLPAGQPGEIERCTFCAAETRARAERAERIARAPRSPWTSDSWKPPRDSSRDSLPPSVPKARSPVVFMVAVAVLVAVVGIVLVVREGKGGGGGAKSSSGPHTSATSASNTPPRPITVVGLASAHLDQWKNLTSTPLDAPPITGDYAHFDVVANLDWASSIATAWSPDATLWRLYAQGVTPDGVVNVSTGGKGSVILQFNSVAKGDLDLMIELHIPRGSRTARPVRMST